MDGHVKKRGTSWGYWVDAGRFPAQRCTSCRHRRWADRGPVESCEKCGAELGDVVLERRQLTKSGFATKGAASSSMRERIRTVESGGDPVPSSITVREFAERWLTSDTVRGLRPRTRSRYRQVLVDHVLPIIGSMKVTDVRRRHVAAVLEGVTANGLTARSAEETRAIVSSLFRAALDLELIESNPASGARVPKKERAKLVVPTTEQLVALIAVARGTTHEIPLLLAATSGMRRSEVLGLRWANVDLDTGVVNVVENLQRVRDEKGSRLDFLDPKTDRSRRAIVLPQMATLRLRSWKAEQAARQLRLGPAWMPMDLVCDRGDGGPLDPDGFSNAFKRAAAKAGLDPATRLHDVRHGVATALLQRGVDTVIAAAVLGHSNPGFTASTYQHVLTGMTGQAAAALDEALGQ